MRQWQRAPVLERVVTSAQANRIVPHHTGHYLWDVQKCGRWRLMDTLDVRFNSVLPAEHQSPLTTHLPLLGGRGLAPLA